MISADEIIYRQVRQYLNADAAVCPGRFLNKDGRMTVDSVKQELIEGYDTPEGDALEWATRWVAEPRNAIHIDPFTQP